MPRGGKREGAGRKPGSLNKKCKELAEKLLLEGETPLEHMLGVMRSPDVDQKLRVEVAKAAAPYIHPRLSAIEHAGDDGGALMVILSGADAKL
jgi:hypothetical protein